jgi:hypothetical protein
VAQPLSDYLRFEFEHYRHNVEAGETVRILDVTNRANPLAGVRDFWMFDRSQIVLMHYAQDGTQISREVCEGDPEPFREYQRIALAESVRCGRRCFRRGEERQPARGLALRVLVSRLGSGERTSRGRRVPRCPDDSPTPNTAAPGPPDVAR